MLKIKLFLFVLIFSTSGFAVFSQTEDWNQYSSAMGGFKVEYPSDWRAEDNAYERVWHTSFISPGVRDYDVTMTSSIGICSQPKGHFSTSSNSRSRCSQRDDHLSKIAKNKVVSEEILEINGLQIRKKITKDKYRPTTTYIYAFLSNKDRDFLVSSSFPGRFNLNKYAPVFGKMLSTILLLGEKTVLTYENEKYDLALTYPTSWKSCPITRNTDQNEEKLLILVPEGKLCNGGNHISVSRMTKLSNEKTIRICKSF